MGGVFVGWLNTRNGCCDGFEHVLSRHSPEFDCMQYTI